MVSQHIKLEAAARNNDLVALIGWNWLSDGKLEGCVGFAITRIDETGAREVLGTKIPFDGQENPDWKYQPSTVWPIQRMWQLDYTGRSGKTYTYEIQAMGGTPGNLVAIEGVVAVTNPITLTTRVDDTFEVAFTRGTLSTQWMSRLIGVDAEGNLDFQKIIDALADYKNPNNLIRRHLVGNVPAMLMAPVKECATDGGHVYQALYELSANELVDFMVENHQYFSLILGNTGADDFVNAPARALLHQSGAAIWDRMIGSWGIAHNKSQVKVDRNDVPTDVTTGSTNWTNTGLGCQANMACRIRNPQVAGYFMDYWHRLLADNSQQSLRFRRRNALGYDPVTLSDGTVIETYFQPSMDDRAKPKGEVPLSPFLQRVKNLMAEAAADGDSVICGEVFYPGAPSVVHWMADLWNANPELYMFMTVSTPDAVRGVKTMRRVGRQPLFTIATGREKEFADFITELLKLPESHAITHGKIIVIMNQRTGKYSVVFGSDNLGAKASYANDENGLIVSGNAALAWYVFVNMFDINKHYFTRSAGRAASYSQEDRGYTGKLATTDAWQANWVGKYKAREAKLLATGRWDGKGLTDRPGATPVLVVPYPKRKPKVVPAADAAAGENVVVTPVSPVVPAPADVVVVQPAAGAEIPEVVKPEVVVPEVVVPNPAAAPVAGADTALAVPAEALKP